MQCLCILIANQLNKSHSSNLRLFYYSHFTLLLDVDFSASSLVYTRSSHNSIPAICKCIELVNTNF